MTVMDPRATPVALEPPEGHEVAYEVSVVMPCLDEAETVASCIRKAQKALAAHGLRGEVIVADNGSTDGSREIALRCGARVVRVAKKGYGAAIMGGVAAAQGTCVIIGDSDDSYDFGQLVPFVEKLREGYDLVMGCRFPGGRGQIMPGAMPWTHRWIGTPVLTAIGRLFFRAPVSDVNCGLRAIRREAFGRLDLRMTGMEFASEMIIKAALRGLRITEIPIVLHKAGRSRPPHLRSWRDGWRHLRFMLLFSPRWLFLVPGGALFLLGIGAGALLMRGPVGVGSVYFDTNTLLVSAMAALVGFKLMAFAMFSKAFAVSAGLLPRDPRVERVLRVITLEVGILLGLFVALGGLALLGAGLFYWQRHGFGSMSYPASLRLIIPGVTAMTLGVEVVFSSFFVGVLGLSRK